jgi:hypothetical protein
MILCGRSSESACDLCDSARHTETTTADFGVLGAVADIVPAFRNASTEPDQAHTNDLDYHASLGS